ncbi:hypothetical protein M434DRAFT_30978 [Hypoxylon sp. CO27-5]|nr:hypothetical protein M434DRAFT_30978 [Hypoxylon sp. CO27-5]
MSGPVLGTTMHAINLTFFVTVAKDAGWEPDEQVHRDVLDKMLPVLDGCRRGGTVGERQRHQEDLKDEPRGEAQVELLETRLAEP